MLLSKVSTETNVVNGNLCCCLISPWKPMFLSIFSEENLCCCLFSPWNPMFLSTSPKETYVVLQCFHRIFQCHPWKPMSNVSMEFSNVISMETYVVV